MSTHLIISGTTRRRAGGWAYTLSQADSPVSAAAGGEWGGSGPRMELMSLVEGLGACTPGPVEVRLTSEGTLRTATEWLPAWKSAGWKRRSGGAIRNLDLVKRLDALLADRAVTWILAEGRDAAVMPVKARAVEAASGVEQPPPPPEGAPVTGTVGPTQKRLLVYTDGGCRGNPGVGGWGFLLIDTQSGVALSKRGGEAQTTNNRMEMSAAIEALEALTRPNQSVEIRTDSKYLVDLATKWMHGWKRKGWTRKGKAPIKNLDLVKKVDVLVQRHDVTWTWVKGHAGEPGNELADYLTNAAMDGVLGGGDGAAEQRFRETPIKVHPG